MSYTTICRARRPDGSRCGVLTTDRRGYCPQHATFGSLFTKPKRRDPFYASAAWRKVRAEVLSAHFALHGHVCPGWRRPAHQATSFAVDHIRSRAAGGAPLDKANLRALCVSCNSRKSLRDRYE